jgi:hypothetical protein
LKAVAAQVTPEPLSWFLTRPSSFQVFFSGDLGFLVSKGGHLGLSFLPRNRPHPFASRADNSVCLLDQGILESLEAPGHVTGVADDCVVFVDDDPITKLGIGYLDSTLRTLPAFVADARAAFIINSG